MQAFRQTARAVGRAARQRRHHLATCAAPPRQWRASTVGLSRAAAPPLLSALRWRPLQVAAAPGWRASQFRAAASGGGSSLTFGTGPFGLDDIDIDVGCMLEGSPQVFSSQQELEDFAEALMDDAAAATRVAVLRLLQQQEAEDGEPSEDPPGTLEVSLVLCDDAHISELNMEWRGKEGPTDVLSFEMDGAEEEEGEGEEEEEDGDAPELPVKMLGDVVVSLDTAARQAAERGHSVLAEVRILLVHGILHILGYDHEHGEEMAEEMAAAEADIMSVLGWEGQGLIAAAGSEDGLHEPGSGGGRGPALYQPPMPASASGGERGRAAAWETRPEVQALALDMDGTLLDGNSRVLPSSVEAIRAALDAGIVVMLATGKARPAAMAAMQAVGLAGEGLVISHRGPGVFLQGLAAYGRGGAPVFDGELPPAVVSAAFEYASLHGIPVCGFMGDECVTIRMDPEVRELHQRYYEPLAEVVPSLAAVPLAGMRKLLFMTSPQVVEHQLKPHWQAALEGTEAEVMQAVPNMLEVVPRGWNKWLGLTLVMDSLGIPTSSLMAIGDGSNDLEMVGCAGVGVAMGNAVPAVKEVAALVVASNDEHGVAEAIEKLIL